MKLNYQIDGQCVIVTPYEGETFSKATHKHDAVRFDAASVPDMLESRDGQRSAKAYGVLKLLQDRTSQCDDPAEKLAEMQRYFAVFVSGQWREYKEPAGGSAKLDALFVAAVAQVKQCSVAQAEAGLRKLDAATVKAIRALPAVQAALAALRAEAGATVELDDLLA